MSTKSTCGSECPGRRDPTPAIPTPDEFESQPRVARSTGIDHVVQTILDQLSGVGQVPAVVNVSVYWSNACYVTEAIKRFEARGWRVKINKSVSIFGFAHFDLVMTKAS